MRPHVPKTCIPVVTVVPVVPQKDAHLPAFGWAREA